MLSNQDLQDLQTATRLLVELIERHNVQGENAAERRALFRLIPNEKPPATRGADGKEQDFVEFTEKEIYKMPKIFKTLIIIKKKRCRIRRRQCGSATTYEIRFRSDGFNISACGKTKELAKANFLKKLQKITPNERHHDERDGVPTTFTSFARFYFERFREKKVTAETFEKDFGRVKRYLFPYFEERPLRTITPTTCATIIERVAGEGKGKTADELHSLMNAIFKSAILHGLIERNPLDVVCHVTYEQESGVALTREEEEKLFARLAEPLYRKSAAILLYTGLRPNELATATVEGVFIVAKNSKRKNRKTEYKKIPICAKLRPYVAHGIGDVATVKLLRRRVKAALPEHKLYDLRTTFYTRCDELGVAPPARDHFVGHSAGKLTNAYRDLSEKYLLEEGKKLDLW